MRALPIRIVTARLRLRSFRRSDAAEMANLFAASREHLEPWVTIPPEGADLGEILASLERRFDDDDGGYRAYAITLATSGRVVGCVSLGSQGEDEGEVEIGYWLAAGATGLGYAWEAAGAVCATAEAVGVTCIRLRCQPDNHASTAVAMRLGFRLEKVGAVNEWSRTGELSSSSPSPSPSWSCRRPSGRERWVELVAELGRRYVTWAATGGGVEVRVDGLAISVRPGRSRRRDWVVVACRLERQLDAETALALDVALDVGRLAIQNDELVLRTTCLLDLVDPETIRRLAADAVRVFAALPAPASSAALFSAFAS